MTDVPSRPGEALEKDAQEKYLDWWFYLAGALVASVVLLITGWTRRFMFGAPVPWDATIVATSLAIWLGVKLRWERRSLRKLLLGARGEREVGAVLDELRSLGYHVFHQVAVPNNGETLESCRQHADHVIVGPAGVYVIETKKRSHKNGRPPIVSYDGAQNRVNGIVLDPCPIQQVTRYATGIGKHIRVTTGIGVFVRGVVLFPGSVVREKRGAGAGGKPWVLAPERLRIWLQQELKRPELSPSKAPLPLSRVHVERIATEIRKLDSVTANHR